MADTEKEKTGIVNGKKTNKSGNSGNSGNSNGNSGNSSNEEKILELNYKGFAFSKISDFIVNSKDNLISNRTVSGISGDDKDIETQSKFFFDNVLLRTFIEVEKYIKSKERREDGFYIEREAVRKNDTISIFWDKEDSDVEPENHTVSSKINGVVGALTYEYSEKNKHLLNTSWGTNANVLKIGKTFKKVRVNVEIYSLLDRKKPKLGENNSSNYEDIHSYFTATMLTYGKIESFNNDVPCGMDNLFDFLLIDVLSKSLEKAYKKGFFRTYRQFYENNDRIKGTIDVARHIRLNTGMQNGKIAYRYRENTVNNYLSILILKTYRYIKKKYPDIVRRKIDENGNLHSFFQYLQYELDEQTVSLHAAIEKNLKPISHPYFSEYEAVRKVCLRILRKQGLSIFESNRGMVNGFLYYLPDLWEDYLNHRFKEILYRKYEGFFVEDQKEEGFLTKYDTTDDYLCISRPDFIFTDKSKNNKMMIDAKMIPGMEIILKDDTYTQKNYSSAIDKCIRDMVVFGLEKVGTGVVFPVGYEKKITKDEVDDNELKEELVKEWYSKSVKYIKLVNKARFYVIPFVVPVSTDYESYYIWKEQFNRFEKIFSEEMEEIFDELLLQIHQNTLIKIN